MSDRTETSSHVEALESTSIIGGSTMIVLLIRMIRTKIMALLLGPAGIGLEAIYDSVVSLARSASNLGISSSGVRQIAAATGSGDQAVVARTVFTLRRTSVALGILGAIALFVVREPVSRIAFGDPDHSWNIGILSAALFCGSVMAGQGALLQGMRRIRDLAKMNILGAVAGTIIGIPIIYVWGQEGIPAYLVMVAAAGVGISWFYARRVPLSEADIRLKDVAKEARSLLQLGVVFLSSALMTIGALFLIRAMVARQEGLDGVGQFQAASALSLAYVNVVLQAMGTDFYPRLTAVAEDNGRCNQLVNEQAEISVLLALPGVLVTLALAPWIIHGFYSDKFNDAAEILSWLIAGMMLRVATWPMGYIIVAKGRGTIFFLTELVAYSVYTFLSWLGLKFLGLPGLGIAFVGLNVFHWCLMWFVARRVSSFAWSDYTLRLTILAIAVTAVGLANRLEMDEPWATGIGCMLALIGGIFCVRTLVNLVGRDRTDFYLDMYRIPPWLRRAVLGQNVAVPVP